MHLLFTVILTLTTMTFTIMFVPQALADTVYLRDTLYVPLRGGQSSEHRILHRGIRSGTELQRLEVNEDSGYSRVQMSDGLEGWIQSQYLSEEPTAELMLNEELSNIEAVRARNIEVLAQLELSQSSEQALSESNMSLQQQNTELREELEHITGLAVNVISINEENKQLRDEHDSLLGEIDAISVSNQAFQDTSDQKWFLNGAGTILVGLLFGFWFSRRIYNRRSTSGWS